MLAVYKKELKSYFISMLGYAFIAFLLVVVGFCFYMTNVKNNSPFVGYAFDTPYIPIIFMVLVPVMTMKIFADERATKTDQMLFTAPIKISDIVMGKFLAIVTIYTIPMIMICCYPLILSEYGNVPMLNSYVAILGFWLMGIAYFAIGLYISAITENQMISAVVTFAVIFVSFISQYVAAVLPETNIAGLIGYIVLAQLLALLLCIAGKKNKGINMLAIILDVVATIVMVVLYVVNPDIYASGLQNILFTLSIDYNLTFFLRDFLDIPTVLYYLSIVVFFIFMTRQSIQKNRG